jgi:hypothetical protein
MLFVTEMKRLVIKYSVLTAKKTQFFTVTEINRLTLFKEMIAVYSEIHTKPTNKKWKANDY